MKIYLAGPMRSIPHLNAPAFKKAAHELRAAGFEVFNPVEESEKRYGPGIYDEPDAGGGVDERLVFGVDLAWLCAHADAVALMPGWETSRGARAERAVAIALGLQILMLAGEPP